MLFCVGSVLRGRKELQTPVLWWWGGEGHLCRIQPAGQNTSKPLPGPLLIISRSGFLRASQERPHVSGYRITELAERQAEDLKVRDSVPGFGARVNVTLKDVCQCIFM